MRIQFTPNKKIRIIFYERTPCFRAIYCVSSHKTVVYRVLALKGANILTNRPVKTTHFDIFRWYNKVLIWKIIEFSKLIYLIYFIKKISDLFYVIALCIKISWNYFKYFYIILIFFFSRVKKGKFKLKFKLWKILILVFSTRIWYV